MMRRFGRARCVRGGAVVWGVSLSLTAEVGGQARVEWTTDVSADVSAQLLVETWLAVDPLNPAHMVATAMVPREGGSALWVTRDGGRRWSRAVEGGSGASIFDDMDPIVAFGPDGVPWFGTLADGFTVWRGEAGGARWSRVGTVPGGTYDREWIDFDRSGGERHGRMYTMGKVPVQVLGQPARDIAAVSWSDDGAPFRQARLVLPDPSRGAMNVITHMIVLPGGGLAAAFQFFPWNQTGREGLIEGEMQTMLSRDGREWAGPFTAAPLRVFGNRGDETLMVKGLGGGRLATSSSGGALYLTWSQEIDGFLQIVLVTSDNGGRTWSAPVRVNDGGLRSHHSNPTVAVNNQGNVAVLWNDRREDATDACFVPRVSVSADGGRTFGASAALTGAVCPPPGRWINGGDTQGLVALPDGAFQALFVGPDRGHAGATRIMTGRISVDVDPGG